MNRLALHISFLMIGMYVTLCHFKTLLIKFYQILTKLYFSGSAIDLTNSKGTKFSDAYTTSWDAVKAIKTESGFQVLLDGAASNENQFYVWTTNSSGVITKGSGWKTGDQMMQLGYEDIFAFNMNDNPGIGI